MKKYTRLYLNHFGFVDEMETECEVCGKVPANDVHHIVYKSQGGNDSIVNLIGLCRKCHDKAHFKQEPYLDEEMLRTAHNKYLIKKNKWQT